ncbi:MAG: hypothetical protein RLZZ441_111 [Actinomycetota bacterium]
MTRTRPTSGVVPPEDPMMFQGRKVLRDEALGESLNL